VRGVSALALLVLASGSEIEGPSACASGWPGVVTLAVISRGSEAGVGTGLSQRAATASPVSGATMASASGAATASAAASGGAIVTPAGNNSVVVSCVPRYS